MNVTIAPGDGIGPETLEVALDALRAAGAPITLEAVSLTDLPAAVEAARNGAGVLLKGPSADPEVTAALRRLAGTFADKRVYRMLPGVPTPLGLRELNLTLVCERQGDELRGDERMVRDGVAACRRYASRDSALRVHRYTFEMAARKGARRVTCGHLADVMKLVDGLFLEAFYEVAAEYPKIRADDLSIDKLALQLVSTPEAFDVIVLPDMPGDIIPDLAAGLVGGLAYAPSALIGEHISIFEPVHGPSAELAGRDLANPTAMVLAATMLLRHVGRIDEARLIERSLERASYAINRSRAVRSHVGGFRTSVFRYLLVAELQTELRTDLQRELQSTPHATTKQPSANTSMTTTQWIDRSLSSQLEGLA